MRIESYLVFLIFVCCSLNIKGFQEINHCNFRGLGLKKHFTCQRITGGSKSDVDDAFQYGNSERRKWNRVFLVTGGCGFLGSAVVQYLTQRYPNDLTIVVDRLDECATLKNIEEVLMKPNFIFIHNDIRNMTAMEEVLRLHSVCTVLHLAAQTSVDKSFQDPLDCCEHNVVGTQSLLECCRRYRGVHFFLYFSTDEVYGETPSGWRAETDELRPTNPYSASKAAAEHLALAYGRICAGASGSVEGGGGGGMVVVVTRCCNIYGPRQFPEKVIPRFALRCRRGLSSCIYGDGRAVRTFIYIDDVVEALETVMARGRSGEVYNIGTDEEARSRCPTPQAWALFGVPVAWRMSAAVANPGCRLPARCKARRRAPREGYSLDWRKLGALGWAPRVRLAEGLPRTLAWYLAVDPEAHWGAEAVRLALLPSPGGGGQRSSHFALLPT